MNKDIRGKEVSIKYWYNECEPCSDNVVPEDVKDVHDHLFEDGTTGNFMNYVVTLNGRTGITAELRYDSDCEENLRVSHEEYIKMLDKTIQRLDNEKLKGCDIFIEEYGCRDYDPDWECYLKLFIPDTFTANESKEAEGIFYRIVMEEEKMKDAGGKPVYTHNVATDILDIFDDFLCSHGIRVPSADDAERSPDNEASLYGEEYSNLLDMVELYIVALMKNNGIKSVNYIYE